MNEKVSEEMIQLDSMRRDECAWFYDSAFACCLCLWTWFSLRDTLLICDNIILLMGQLTMTFKDAVGVAESIAIQFQQCLNDAPPSIALLIIQQLASSLIDASVRGSASDLFHFPIE